MKLIKPLLFLYIILNVATAINVSSDSINDKIGTTDIIKGTVTHVFQEIKGAQRVPQKIAKTRLHSEPGNQELSLIELKDSSIRAGDQIIIAKLESETTFGMGDVFEYQLEFVDFARDHFVLYLFVPLLFLVFFINKRSLILTLTFVLNLFFIFLFLPFLVNLNLDQKILYLIFTVPFLLVNGLLFKQIFAAKNFNLAITTSTLATIFTAYCYHLYAQMCRINEYQIISNRILTPTLHNFSATDYLVILVGGYFIYTFSALFFINVTYKKNLYSNFSLTIWKIALFYLFLTVGLNLPLLTFFMHNGFGLLQLFNYLPFIRNLIKLLFLFWGNILCCTLYLFFFYSKHKLYFQKHLQIKNTLAAQMPLDLLEVMAEHKEQKYTDLNNKTAKKEQPVKKQKHAKKKVVLKKK